MAEPRPSGCANKSRAGRRTSNEPPLARPRGPDASLRLRNQEHPRTARSAVERPERRRARMRPRADLQYRTSRPPAPARQPLRRLAKRRPGRKSAAAAEPDRAQMNHFTYRGGEFCCEDVRLSEIARAVGTPVYVYSTATLEHHFAVFKAALAPRDVLVAFAVKA